MNNISNIVVYNDEELDKYSTCSILEQVAKDGKIRKMNFYNLDIIISVGYRVNSKKATKFRQWATKVLKSYIQNSYVINADKITNERFVYL
ncbi:RhuM family protein [Poseidonibacter sp.]|uniref:RhuM family protein n=1 Tax=Poseidonibacter sp. TaxID=2321188 RepID=UPI003C789BB8